MARSLRIEFDSPLYDVISGSNRQEEAPRRPRINSNFSKYLGMRVSTTGWLTRTAWVRRISPALLPIETGLPYKDSLATADCHSNQRLHSLNFDMDLPAFARVWELVTPVCAAKTQVIR